MGHLTFEKLREILKNTDLKMKKVLVITSVHIDIWGRGKYNYWVIHEGQMHCANHSLLNQNDLTDLNLKALLGAFKLIHEHYNNFTGSAFNLKIISTVQVEYYIKYPRNEISTTLNAFLDLFKFNSVTYDIPTVLNERSELMGYYRLCLDEIKGPKQRSYRPGIVGLIMRHTYAAIYPLIKHF